MTEDERYALVGDAERDEGARALFLAMIDDPETGAAFFLNTCCVTFDPRPGPDRKPIGVVPFLLWPEQERAANLVSQCIDNGEDLGQEKSRDMGLTWIDLGVILLKWLRTPGFTALIGAMTEALLDSPKDESTLFWKIDTMYQYLPSFMKVKGYDPDDKNVRSWCAMTNPVNGSMINGAAPTNRFAIGRRKSVVYYDDWAKWEEGAAAWEGAAATAQCRIACWTVNPEDPLNHAYELRFGKGKFENVQVKLLTVRDLHWTSDPRKTRLERDPLTGQLFNPWKRAQIGDPARGIAGRISFEQFQKDYEGVYESNPKGRIYANQIVQARVGKYPYDPRFPTYTGWDYGRGDDCVILWPQIDYENLRIRFVDCLIRSGHGMEYYIPFVTGRSDPMEQLPKEDEMDDRDWEVLKRHETWQKFNRETQKREVPYADHFGDPSGKQKSISHNKSAKQMLEDAGIFVTEREDNHGKGYTGRIEDARRILPFCDFDETHCAPLITALQNYKWSKGGKEPEHDEYSHCAAAFEYFAVNIANDFFELLESRRRAEVIASRGLQTAEFNLRGMGAVDLSPRAGNSAYNSREGANSITGY